MQGKPYAGNPHVRFDEGAGAPTRLGRSALLYKDIIRKTQEFKDLRAKAREAIAAFEDGADFDFTIDRLAAIGEKMNILLG